MLRLLPAVSLLVALALPALVGGQCAGQAPPADSTSLAPPYAFGQPDALLRLPNRLREISGLTLLDAGHLGAIEDERDRLYVIDLETGEVVRNEEFYKNGDYEGVERVEARVFVLRSDGTLFEIEDWQADAYDAIEHETPLGRANDTEGLAYDAANNRLLIACKESPGKGLDGVKAIYAFDLATNSLSAEPVYTIPTARFTAEAGSDHPVNDKIRGIARPVWDLSGFKPSALALHPLTGHLYVLSSVRQAVVVLDPADGRVLDVWPLPDQPYEQPEGLAFLPNGDLFISTEGQGERAALIRLNYRPQDGTAN